MFAVSVVSGSPYELLNSTLTPPADHAFAGWKLSDAGDILQPGDVINPTENAVLYAQWTYTGTGTDPGTGDGDGLPDYLIYVVLLIVVLAVIGYAASKIRNRGGK
jgi:hypothetical protein